MYQYMIHDDPWLSMHILPEHVSMMIHDYWCILNMCEHVDQNQQHQDYTRKTESILSCTNVEIKTQSRPFLTKGQSNLNCLN